MLDPDDVDLDELAQALDDHSAEVSYGHSWWLDPRTGEVRVHSADVDDESIEGLDEAGLIVIEPLPSSVGYADMEDFVELVPDRRAAEMLSRAIEGRGAFRRFKDTLFEFPELRDEWFAFRDARARRHAIGWLEAKDLVNEATARIARTRHSDPEVGGAAANLPRAVAEDLRALYGDRLVNVLVFGSRARGDGTDESDLDLLVVLDHVEDAFEELDRMDDVLWRHTYESGLVVAALPVSADRYARPDEPWLVRAKAEGVAA